MRPITFWLARPSVCELTSCTQLKRRVAETQKPPVERESSNKIKLTYRQFSFDSYYDENCHALPEKNKFSCESCARNTRDLLGFYRNMDNMGIGGIDIGRENMIYIYIYLSNCASLRLRNIWILEL